MLMLSKFRRALTCQAYSTTTFSTRNMTKEGVPLGTAAVPSGTDLPDMIAETTEQTIIQR
jgi:hypothetical protein